MLKSGEETVSYFQVGGLLRGSTQPTSDSEKERESLAAFMGYDYYRVEEELARKHKDGVEKISREYLIALPKGTASYIAQAHSLKGLHEFEAKYSDFEREFTGFTKWGASLTTKEQLGLAFLQKETMTNRFFRGNKVSLEILDASGEVQPESYPEFSSDFYYYLKSYTSANLEVAPLPEQEDLFTEYSDYTFYTVGVDYDVETNSYKGKTLIGVESVYQYHPLVQYLINVYGNPIMVAQSSKEPVKRWDIEEEKVYTSASHLHGDLKNFTFQGKPVYIVNSYGRGVKALY